jgi:ferritin
MMTDKMQKAFNDQINAEMFSGYLYLQMANYFDERNLAGMAQWMEVQAQEEMLHAMKFLRHLHDRGAEVHLQQIDEPPQSWDSVEAAFEAALKHEQYITGRINDLIDLADQEKDRAVNGLLQWFTDEQVEEEDTAQGNLDNARMAGEQGHALLMLDREMAARAFQYPAQVSGEGGTAE